MSAKPGRNAQCPCGSGKKYKKCCYTKDSAAAPKPALKTIKVGKNTYYRPAKETFHEFLFNHLQELLGKDWWDAEIAKKPEDRHILVQWYLALAAFKKRKATSSNKVAVGWGAKANGQAQALLQLAWDVFVLADCDALPASLIGRLRDRHEFQAVRYEIAVAGVFARLRYRIEWLDGKQHQKAKHCEFIAHRAPGQSIGVEAKSRRRSGVLHESKKYEGPVKLRADIANLLRAAVQQKPAGLPFVVFVDLNLPATGGEFPDKVWFEELKTVVSDVNPEVPGEARKPDVFNAIVVTNFATYYGDPEKDSPHGEHVYIEPEKAETPITDGNVLIELREALAHYNTIPDGLDWQ